jgi:hypothetical protein
VTKTNGGLIVTFSHHHFYFSHDDCFVEHYHRYEISEIISLLAEAGFYPVSIQKFLGPLEKITMLIVTICASILQEFTQKGHYKETQVQLPRIITNFFKWCNKLYAGLAWIDALILPRSLSTVLLIKAKKGGISRNP